MNNFNDLEKQYVLLVQRMLQGVGAFTVQPYTEVNIKRGKQFEASGSFTIAAGASVDLVYISGSKPCILKGKEVFFTGEKITLSVFEGPTYTGGTEVPVFNLTRINPSASEATLLSGATVTATGTKTQADRVLLGSATSGSKTSSTSMAEGIEHVFSPNTTYLERITNNNGVDADVSIYLTWYEGDLDY